MFDLKDAVAAAEKVVAGHEDYIYEWPVPQSRTCLYAVPGSGDPEPSCVVGHIVALLDPDTFKRIAALEVEFENTSFGAGALVEDNTPSIHDNQTPDDIRIFDKSADRFLSTLQMSQDAGSSWGEALRKAKSSVSL